MTKTILITGGSGYVGTRLINKLLNETDIKLLIMIYHYLEILIYQKIQN